MNCPRAAFWGTAPKTWESLTRVPRHSLCPLRSHRYLLSVAQAHPCTRAPQLCSNSGPVGAPQTLHPRPPGAHRFNPPPEDAELLTSHFASGGPTCGPQPATCSPGCLSAAQHQIVTLLEILRVFCDYVSHYI